MKITIEIDVPMPRYTSDDTGMTLDDTYLFNAKRDADTRSLVEKAVRSVLVKRGAWEPKMKVSVSDTGEAQ